MSIMAGGFDCAGRGLISPPLSNVYDGFKRYGLDCKSRPASVGCVPRTFRTLLSEDALHVAVSCVNGMNYIANAKKRAEIERLCAEFGYPIICTPEELLLGE